MLNHQFQTFLEEFNKNKSQIPDQELQKLQYILKCIELEGVDMLEFEQTLFPDIQQDVLQTLFNMPINGKKSMFIALMKSLEINQEKEVIKGELDIKQEVYSQWKIIELKLNIESGILQIFNFSSNPLTINLHDYQIQWEGKYLSFSKKYGFKILANTNKSVKYKNLFFGSDDTNYAHEWFGWFQQFYKHYKKETNNNEEIIQRRDSIGSKEHERRQSFIENQKINMMASNDQPHEKSFQVEIKLRSQSFSGSLEKILDHKVKKPPLSKFHSNDALPVVNEKFSQESKQPQKLLEINLDNIIQESEEQGTPNLESEFEDVLPIENHSINETLDENIPEQLRTFFISKAYQIEKILNLDGYRIDKATDQYRIYIGIKNDLMLKGHIAFQKKQENIIRFFKNHKLLKLIKEQDSSLIYHSGIIQGSEWRLQKIKEHQRFQATFLEPSHNNTIELVYYIENGFLEKTSTYSLNLCIYFFKQHIQCAYAFQQQRNQTIKFEDLHQNIINLLME